MLSAPRTTEVPTMCRPDSIPDPSALLPSPGTLRARLARALRDVDILRGLLRLSESVARRDGSPVLPADAERKGVADAP
jgi:hypothetical protein